MRRRYTVVVFVVLASLDNVAAALVPQLFKPIAREFGVAEAAIAAVSAAAFLITAIASVGWGYLGDRSNRKPLLMIGTLTWAVGTLGTALAPNYAVFFLAQVVGALGLGAVGSIGFSVVSDLITPRRRGLVMSFWGLSQGVGTLAGGLVGGLLGASDWHRPFLITTIAGVAATTAYLFTQTIHRGQSEPQLAGVFAAGEDYDYRISRADLPVIARRRTNIWLVLQGITAQLVFGSLVFLPRLIQAKAEQLGHTEEVAIQIGSLYSTLFALGGALSVVGGLVGDRLQRRTKRGRALVAGIGVLGGIPFYLVVLFAPLRIELEDGRDSVVLAVLRSIVTEPVMAASLLTAIVALALTSANSPNWFALITDVNPPEHRGTVYSLGNLANGIGRSAGTWLAGRTFEALARSMPPPMNFVVGIVAFQVFFIPTGIMFLLAARTAPRDIDNVQHLLGDRAEHPHAGSVRPGSVSES
jgi:MFS transporter, Spinster family, sphingosine-1-phosphate transporter